MAKYLFLIFAAIRFSSSAQTPDEGKAILEPVTRLFKGMNLGDSAMVHSAFTEQVSTATISKDKTGNPTIRYESSLDGFLKAVGTPHDKAWNGTYMGGESRAGRKHGAGMGQVCLLPGQDFFALWCRCLSVV